MTKKTISQLRGLALPELEEKLADCRQKLAKERSIKSSGTRPEKPATIRNLRKAIARCLTIMEEKKNHSRKTAKTGNVKVAEKAKGGKEK